MLAKFSVESRIPTRVLRMGLVLIGDSGISFPLGIEAVFAVLALTKLKGVTPAKLRSPIGDEKKCFMCIGRDLTKTFRGM